MQGRWTTAQATLHVGHISSPSPALSNPGSFRSSSPPLSLHPSVWASAVAWRHSKRVRSLQCARIDGLLRIRTCTPCMFSDANRPKNVHSIVFTLQRAFFAGIAYDIGGCDYEHFLPSGPKK